ncbi:MAG: hypothetical protein R3B93_07880 [Bacteroidia bacterium]
MGNLIPFLVFLTLILSSSCNLSKKLTIDKISDRTQVEFDDIKFLFYGDYQFRKRKNQLTPGFPKALFSNLGIGGKIYGIGNTRIEPYFSMMIQKSDWLSLPDQLFFQNQVEKAGGLEFKAEPWTRYKNALMLSYQVPAESGNSVTYVCEHVFVYRESVYRMTFWSDDRPENLYRESRAIFQTFSHP